MTFAELRALFPSAETSIHLNHAGTSPIARPVANAVHVVLDELMQGDPFLAYKNHMKRQELLREALGRMMNVSPSTFAFTKNTSHSLSLAAQGIPFAPGDSVVVPSVEYPSNVYPWMAQAHRGVTVRRVPARENDGVSEDDLIAACDKTTRVLSVSWVQWGTGQRLDLEKLGTFCRAKGIIFVADVVQGLGALRLDLGKLPVDIAAAGCHKWLLAPGGVGFVYIRPEVFADFLPTNIGWNSVDTPTDWDRMHYHELKTTPDRMEEGTPGLLATAALRASVDLLEGLGYDTIEDRVLALADHAREALAQRGDCKLMSPAGEGQKTGIVTFRHQTKPNDAVLAALAAQNIVAAVRCGNVRFSPHAYSIETDIETAARAIG